MDRDSRKWKLRPPKGLGDFIRGHCAERFYIVFDEKHGMATCTGCNEEFDYEDLGMWFTHSKDASMTVGCPLCGRPCIPKNVRYGRNGLRDEGRVIWFRAIGGVTFMEMDDFIIDYRTVHPTIWAAPSQQIRLSKKDQMRLDWVDTWNKDGGSWEQVKKIRVKHPHTMMYGARKEHTHVMWESLEKLGTDLRYANVDSRRFQSVLFDEYDDAQRLIRYMSDFMKYQAIELLEKAGFEQLVMDRAEGKTSKQINIKGKELRKILRLNGAEVRYLQKMEPDMDFMDDIRMIREKWPKAPIEDIEELTDLFPRYISEEKLKRISRMAKWDKVLQMLLENNRSSGRGMTVSDYADYLGWIRQMGLRRDKRTIYPRDFQEAHDDLMNKVKEEKDRPMLEEFWNAETEITGMEAPYIADGLLIRPAASPAELRRESAVLGHCVRTYVTRVVRGDTAILFIRKEEEPDKPLYTLELSTDGRVVQCRGYRNCGYPDEVGQFIEKWMKWRDKKLRAA